tara:strand:- start:93 stop:218 length:126 start_codon:yes stop_codon:yes gene_type:complete
VKKSGFPWRRGAQGGGGNAIPQYLQYGGRSTCTIVNIPSSV